MDLVQGTLLFLSAGLAGAINSVAGGGTLVAFPAALVLGGLPARIASATSAVALTPAAMAAAWAYRRELRGKERLAMKLAIPAIAGGLIGAWLLQTLEERLFEVIVPWMLFGASVLIVGKDFVFTSVLAARDKVTRRSSLLLAAAVFAVSIYSGYFGAGKNIMMLALLTVLARMDIIQANAVKSAMVSMFMLVTSVYFLFTGMADPMSALIMAAGAATGSFGGASVARRVRPVLVRYAVVGIGLTLSAVLAYRQFTA